MTKLEIAAVVSGSKTRLRKMIPLVRDFLREQLGLELNKRIVHLNKKSPLNVSNSVNSYLGITSHFRAYNIRKNWVEGPLAILSYRLYKPYRLHVTNKLLSYARPVLNTRAA